MSVGDVVVLNSGGPKMTVIEVANSGARVLCAWMDDRGEYDTAWLPREAVQEL